MGPLRPLLFILAPALIVIALLAETTKAFVEPFDFIRRNSAHLTLETFTAFFDTMHGGSEAACSEHAQRMCDRSDDAVVVVAATTIQTPCEARWRRASL